MPQPRQKAADDRRASSQVALTGLPEEWMANRSASFQHAMNRKGLPTTWGTGIARTDKAWKRDLEYLREDNGGKWP